LVRRAERRGGRTHEQDVQFGPRLFDHAVLVRGMDIETGTLQLRLGEVREQSAGRIAGAGDRDHLIEDLPMRDMRPEAPSLRRRR
jgi:hypothetical protein